MRDEILNQLFDRRGEVTRIAAALGISTAAISSWKRVPKKRLDDVSRLTGIAKSVLRPDLCAEQGKAA